MQIFIAMIPKFSAKLLSKISAFTLIKKYNETLVLAAEEVAKMSDRDVLVYIDERDIALGKAKKLQNREAAIEKKTAELIQEIETYYLGF